MQRAMWAVLLVIGAAASTGGQTAVGGEIAGRITDARTTALPGVRIVISSGDERREAITDKDGRFVLGMLKLGTYRVAAELAGFVSTSGTITLSPSTRRAQIVWPLQIGCIEEDVRVVYDARRAAPLVDAIVQVRVTSDNGGLLWSERPECRGRVMHSYNVEVVNTVVRRSGTDAGGTTREILLPPGELPLKAGGECLLFLWPEWHVGEGLVFPIVSGRIASRAGDALNGMRTEEAVKALDTWSREPRR